MSAALQSVTEPAIALNGVSVGFGRMQVVLDDVSFNVPAGGFLTMIGPSGSGKSTLLRVIADLITPLKGRVSIFGASAHEARKRREIGFVFQDSTLLPWRSVIDNVRLPLEVRAATPSATQPYSPEELLDLMGLSERKDALPQELSGGMRQRVAIARALICKPRLILMDEPFGALDEITRDKLNGEVLRIWQETGATIVFVTHSIAEAVRLGQQVLVLESNPGRVRAMLDIDLPPRRQAADCETPEFTAYASTLRRLLETC